jgi:hypothetical protein
MRRRTMSTFVALVGGFVVCQSASATAFSLVIGHATRVENALPGLVYFQIDVPAGTCAAGTWLKYVPPTTFSTADQMENAKGAYALLLAAISSGARIAVYGDDSVSPCPITSVSVLAN